MNKALLGKWIWRFACAKEEFWKKILKESDWCWENMAFKVGKGNKIRFWTDPWCGSYVLSQSFPNLFAMATHRNATVEEKVRRRLALWKHQYIIPKGGRIILIKSTMTSMPLYQMSLFRMPKLVARRLEKLQRDFLWGGDNGEKKAHLVNWEVVCVDKEKGGLRLGSLLV